MSTILLLFPAMKPERMIISHIPFWVALLYFGLNSFSWWRTVLGAIAFLLFYGAIYIMNDILDFDADRKDKHNRSRIIASGDMTRWQAGSFAVAIFLLASLLLWSSVPQAVGLLLILWGMNALYSGVLKSIPYVDLLFIAWTQPLKFVLGALLCGVGLAAVTPFVSLLVASYFAALLMHSEKQLGRMQENRQRHFYFGAYSKKGLAIIRWFALIGAYVFTLIAWRNPLFGAMLLVLVAVTFLRFVLPGNKGLSLIEKFEGIFQPR